MKTTPDESAGQVTPPSPEMMGEMGVYIEEGFKNGTLVATGALDPRTTRIQSSGGKITVTDGPFSEAKEAVVGWAIVEVKSKEEAIELSKRFWQIVGDGQDHPADLRPRRVLAARGAVIAPDAWRGVEATWSTARSMRCGGWSRPGSSPV